MKITIRVTEDATNRYGTVTGERVIIDCSDQTFTPTLTANFLRAFADEIAPRRRDVQRTLNCPVCGSGEEGDCICEAAEAIAKAKWEASGLAVREGPWSAVGIIKRRSLIIKALPEAAEQRAERHHHSRKAMECVHNGPDCCVECCEPGGVFEGDGRG